MLLCIGLPRNGGLEFGFFLLAAFGWAGSVYITILLPEIVTEDRYDEVSLGVRLWVYR